MWETVDPEGRRVVLEHRRWEHIVGTHGDLGVEPEVVLRAVVRPDRRVRAREADEEWFYLSGVGPSHWIKVVVHYEGDRGSVVTAFPRRAFP